MGKYACKFIGKKSVLVSSQIMSTNTSFIEKEWLGLGKKWVDLPPHIKCQAIQYFTIPT
jgi:hypothetical protein